MKRGALFPLLLGLLAFVQVGSAANLKAFFSHAEFFVPGKGPYVETYISFIGNSLQPKSVQGGYIGEAEVVIVFRQGEAVINYSKYTVKSPVAADSNNLPNFIDQQRFMLPNGTYTLELVLADLNGGEPFTYQEELLINFKPDKISFSNIQLVESYKPTEKPSILTKSGFDLVPYVSDFYPKTSTKLIFYNELYNSEALLGKDEKFLISYYIENADNQTRVENYSSFSRKSAAPVVILFGEFPLEELPTGNYRLVIEAKDKLNNSIAETSVYFQRSNPSDLSVTALELTDPQGTFVSTFSEDSLNQFLKAIYPVSSQTEQAFANNQLKSSNLHLKQQYFYKFWADRNPANPEAAWLQYHKELVKVDQNFGSGFKRGYSTDRGRIYLKYGPPNTIVEMPNEPNSYPYEIWHYYKIGNFSDRRFIFYNRNLASNDYELLHSDMFGEINNPRWHFLLQERTTPNSNIYQDKGRDHGRGNNADDLYRTPR